MGLTSAIAIYFIMWWLVFFVVLPFGVRTDEEEGGTAVAGSAGSAPARPMLLRKALITSVIAALFFAAFHWIVVSGAISLDDIPFLPDARPEGWEPSWKSG